MKNLQVSFEGIKDTTGYLFSFMKCVAAVCRCSGYAAYAEDIIATSGFAFRMWAAADLCPSAMSIWEFQKQKEWLGNGGLRCEYIERMWGEDAVEEERRVQAIEMIKKSIDRGLAAVAWDLGDCEWGIVKGYDDDLQRLITLKTDGKEAFLPYAKLGRGEVPILSVLVITDAYERNGAELLLSTKRMAAAHLRGEEWCDNAKGLAAYDAITDFLMKHSAEELPWELEYYLGTYAALKWYAQEFFFKYEEEECAAKYRRIYSAWQNAFDILRQDDLYLEEKKRNIIHLLKNCKLTEEEALRILEE